MQTPLRSRSQPLLSSGRSDCRRGQPPLLNRLWWRKLRVSLMLQKLHRRRLRWPAPPEPPSQTEVAQPPEEAVSMNLLSFPPNPKRLLSKRRPTDLVSRMSPSESSAAEETHEIPVTPNRPTEEEHEVTPEPVFSLEEIYPKELAVDADESNIEQEGALSPLPSSLQTGQL